MLVYPLFTSSVPRFLQDGSRPSIYYCCLLRRHHISIVTVTLHARSLGANGSSTICTGVSYFWKREVEVVPVTVSK